MTNKRSRTRRVRVAQVIVAGAATIATHGLFSAVSAGSAATAVAAAPVGATASVSSQPAPIVAGGRVIAVDDNGNSVNDQGQTSGDEFTQNAQDQSTA
jgi:hypothetical protein